MQRMHAVGVAEEPGIASGILDFLRMCGRYTNLFTWKQLHRLMGLTTPPLEKDFVPRYNIAPTQLAPVVRADDRGGVRALAMLRWGLVPSWAKEIKIGASMINARAEAIETKPAFRTALKRRRCIVPVSGFYEWKKLADGKSKQPYYIHSSSEDEPLAFAGLWERWQPPDAEAVETFTIITTSPNQMMKSLHDRMPVILAPEDVDRWLDPANHDAAVLLPLLKPAPDDSLVYYPVSTLVNSPRNDEQACIQPPFEQ